MAAKDRRSLDERAQHLNLWLDECPPVRWLAEKCGISPLAVAGAGFLWFLLFVLWGFMGELVCKVVGNLFPMYASFRALEDEDHDEVSSWLTYWVTFAAFTLLEGASAKLMSWLPFYYVMRLVLILWLFLPATRGAQALYTWTVAPVLRRYRPQVDVGLARCLACFRAVHGEVLVSLFVTGAVLGEVLVLLFVAGAVLGEVLVSLLVAGAVLGEVLVSLLVAGAVLGEVPVLLFVAGAALGEGLNVRLGAKRCILQ
eukprot:symbB.v1.2.035519.t1/scaffold4793.1/size34812/2